jgi:hypothetical protein
LQTCGTYDIDTCTEWGGDTDCPGGQYCDTDKCVDCGTGLSAVIKSTGSATTPALAEITNNSKCDNTVSFCAYNVFIQPPLPGWLDTQVLYKSKKVTLKGSTVQTVPLDVNSCMTQVDVYRGDCVYPLHDHDTYPTLLAGALNAEPICETCTPVCASGEKRCQNGKVQTCGQYDADSCTEWGGDTDCPAGKTCDAGECKCTNHAVKKCDGADLYWYDSCGNKQELFQDCGDDFWTDNYRCLLDWTQREKTRRGCSFDQCFEVNEWVNIEDCSLTDKKCDGGQCKVKCTDECSPGGSKKCTGSGTYQICGSYDSDTCLEWSGNFNCVEGSACQGDGICNHIPKIVTVDLQGPASIVCQAGFTLNWSSVNATSCTASGAWSGIKAVSGAEQIGPIGGSQTYTLTCAGEDDSASDSVTVTSTGNVPAASAGEDKEVSESGSVVLNGSGSGSGTLAYSWSCNGGTLENSETAQPVFKAPDVSRDTYYVCTITVKNDCGSAADTVNVLVSDEEEKKLNVKLAASPNSGCSPVKGVDLTATITKYAGTEGEYTYSFDCENDGDWDKVVTTSSRSYTAEGLCDYKEDKTFTAKVKVENSAKDVSATATASINAGRCHEDHDNFSVSLDVNPDSGCAPLRDVDLAAKITTNHYDDEYTYSFDCENDGDWDKVVATENKSYTVKDLCDYDEDGTFTARVKVVSDDGNFSGDDTAKVEVDDCGTKSKGNIAVDKLVSNFSDGTSYLDSVKADPGEIVSFKVKVTADGGDVDDVVFTDSVPGRIINVHDIMVDGKSVSGSLVSGINLGDLDEGEYKTVTFTASVASGSDFDFGQTNLVNTASAECEQDSCSDSDSATVIVSKTMVEGATTVSTGLTNNPFVDSFVIPGSLALLLIWAFKTKLIKLEEWLDARKKQYARYRSKKILDFKAAKLRSQNIVNRFK